MLSFLIRLTPQNIQVFMGVWNPTRMIAIQNSTVARMIIHPNFNPTTLFNDLAVLRLANPIVLGATANVGTACLPNAQQSFVGQKYVFHPKKKSVTFILSVF